MRPRIIAIVVVLIVVAGGFLVWRELDGERQRGPLTLYGDIDVRQVDLSFKVAAGSPNSMSMKATPSRPAKSSRRWTSAISTTISACNRRTSTPRRQIY